MAMVGDYPLSEDYSRFRVGDIDLGKVYMVPITAPATMPPLMRPIGLERKNTVWVHPEEENAYLHSELDRLEVELAQKDAKIKRLKRKLKQAKAATATM